jgi:D-arabinose 1-dehydrogenase-like Zn-dependent alcohol dehydrogenase
VQLLPDARTCDRPKFPRCTLNGEDAEDVVVDHRYCFSIPADYSDTEVARFCTPS